MRAVLFAIAVILALSAPPAHAQDPSLPSPPTLSEPPVYSLVAARLVQFHARRESDCIRVGSGLGLSCPQYSAAQLSHARSLAGPPVAAERYPATEVTPPADWGQPLLLVMLRGSAVEEDRIVAAAGADREGRACIPAADLDRLGWHPTGPGIEIVDRGVCADLSPVIASWAPDDVYTVLNMDGRRIPPVRASLIIGRVVAQRPSDLPPCPEGARCYRWVRETALADVRTLSGTAVPRSVTITLTQHSGPPDTERILMIVRRDRHGRWVGYWTWPVAASGQDTCFFTYQTAGFTLNRPRRAQVRGQQTCLAL